MFRKKKKSQPQQDQSRGRNRNAVASAREVRTLAGNNQVFSYHANRSAREASFGRDTPEPNAPKRARPRRLHINATQVVPAAAALFLLVMCLSLSSNPKIVTVGATG